MSYTDLITLKEISPSLKDKIENGVADVTPSMKVNTLEVHKNDGTVKEILMNIKGGDGAVNNVFRSGGTQGEFTAQEVTNNFTIPNMDNTKEVFLVYQGSVLIENSNFIINKESGLVTLNFDLQIGESVNYEMIDTSFNYNDLINTPQIQNNLNTEISGSILDASQGKVLDDKISLKADKTYVDTQDTALTEKINVLEGRIKSLRTGNSVTNIHVADMTKAETAQYIITGVGNRSAIPIESASYIVNMGSLNNILQNQVSVTKLNQTNASCDFAYKVNDDKISLYMLNVPAYSYMSFSTLNGTLANPQIIQTVAETTEINVTNYATTTKTEILCTPSTEYTIVSNKSVQINNIVYIKIAMEKSDGTLFGQGNMAIATMPFNLGGGTSNSVPICISGWNSNGYPIPMGNAIMFNNQLWVSITATTCKRLCLSGVIIL